MDVVGSEHSPERRLRVQPAPERVVRCQRCDAPVDEVQRYCVVCGAHQLHADDPAARYMSTLAAQQRAARDAKHGSRGGLTVGRALLVACLPAALVLGALAGRASTNGDAAVAAALRARPAQTVILRSTPTHPASRPSRGQSGTSAQRIKHLGKLTGSGYVKAQQSLPNQISVP